MTYGAIIVCSIITLIIVGMCLGIGYSAGSGIKDVIIGGFVGALISAIMWGCVGWYYNSTEAGKRARKSQDSNFNGGITRRVRVYDMYGDVLEEYTGKFDVDYGSERILFDDENGKRHVIYYKSGTVIVDEIEEKEK